VIPTPARRYASRIRTHVRRITYRMRRPSRGGLRLHLGCGTEYWPGYVNVDASPLSKADLCMSFTDLRSAFADGSLEEVAMIHSLSYLRLWEARDLFRDLSRLLAPGGRVVIELPDVAKCARALIDAGSAAPDRYHEAIRGIYAFDDSWIAGRVAHDTYAFGWSAWHLKSELEQAGFHNVVELDPRTHEQRLWRDIRIEAVR
jgi:SAM-dependent methyltransferase